MYRNRQRRGSTAASALALALSASPAAAADWEFGPKLELGYVYDDNYRLQLPGNENEVSGGLLDAQIELRAQTPLTKFRLVPRVHATYFPDDPDEESEDYFGLLDWERRTQKLFLGIVGDYSRQTVASSEQPSADIDTGLGDTGGADAGIAMVRNRRELARLRPRMTYEFSPRHRLELGAAALDVTFDQQIPGAQVDYRDYGATVGFAFVTTPRSTMTVRALAARYDVDIEANSADAYSLEAEWSTETSQTTRAFVRAGGQRTRFDDDPLTGASREESGFVAGAGFTWSRQLTELFFDATHSVGPTASGFVVERDQVRARLTHLFSPRFSLFVGLRGTQDSAVESTALYPTRDYATGDLGFEWRVLQQLAVVAAVDYTWQEFDGATSDATSSGAAVSFIYEPRRRD